MQIHRNLNSPLEGEFQESEMSVLLSAVPQAPGTMLIHKVGSVNTSGDGVD